jgi:hypothetical protein
MPKTRDVHGHKVEYEDDAKPGVEYLDDRLDYKEAEVFFQQAKAHGTVELEDQAGRDYSLNYDPAGKYAVVRRKSSSGWF